MNRVLNFWLPWTICALATAINFGLFLSGLLGAIAISLLALTGAQTDAIGGGLALSLSLAGVGFMLMFIFAQAGSNLYFRTY